MDWDKKLGVFMMGHEEKKYAGIVGSPSTLTHEIEFLSNAGSNEVSSLDHNAHVAPGPLPPFTRTVEVPASVHPHMRKQD